MYPMQARSWPIQVKKDRQSSIYPASVYRSSINQKIAQPTNTYTHEIDAKESICGNNDDVCSSSWNRRRRRGRERTISLEQNGEEKRRRIPACFTLFFLTNTKPLQRIGFPNPEVTRWVVPVFALVPYSSWTVGMGFGSACQANGHDWSTSENFERKLA